jgi:hypothetical protein
MDLSEEENNGSVRESRGAGGCRGGRRTVNSRLRRSGALVAAAALVTGGVLASLAAPAGAAGPPNAPTVAVSQANTPSIARIKVGFVGDGDPTAAFIGSCTSTAGGSFNFGPVNQSASPVSISGYLAGFVDTPLSAPGVSPVVYNVVTCSVTETVTTGGGTSPEGTASVALTASGPGCVPSGTVTAPGGVSGAAQGFPGAVVSWAPVATDCLIGYLVTPSSGSAVLVLGQGTTTLMKGPFALGSLVGFTVAAVTGAGVGPQSAQLSITIGSPAAPAAVHATAVGKTAIKVSFKAGADNGATITSFTATCGSHSATGKTGPLTVKGLTRDHRYTCAVTAANSRGTGASARSGTVTG